MKENKNEELQSRRSFFKNAAKAALPILGAIALANAPLIAKASESCPCSGTCTACVGGCMDACARSCKAVVMAAQADAMQLVTQVVTVK